MVRPEAGPSPVELGPDEAAVGNTPVAKSANTALRALSRAARAFALYDPKNAIILRFLSEYREKLGAALQAHGDLTFEVLPFSLKLAGESVYEDQDRERSLAFRLFRDGVRTLTMKQGLPWDECVRLLEILSVRISGVRQQEDDIVTLLRKAGFAKLDFTAAEGFAPDEEHPEEPLDEPAGGGRLLTAGPPPSGFDQRLLANEPATAFGWREVPPRFLEALRAEEAQPTVPHHAVRLVEELLRAANGPASELANAELVPFVTEVRDYCIADGASAALLELVRSVQFQHGIGSDLLLPLVAGIAEPASLGHLLDCLPSDLTAAPPELVALLLELPGNHVGLVVERLGTTEDPQVQLVLKDVLRALARRDPTALLERLHTANRQAAALIVPMLMEAAPEQALAMATQLANSKDEGAHLESLEILQRAPHTEAVSNLLAKFSASPSDEVFARTAQVMAAVKERRGFDLLVKQADARATAGTLSHASAVALGESLVSLSPATAAGRFKQWAQLRAGLLGKLSAHHRGLLIAAVAGLGLMKDPEAEVLIKDVLAHTSDDELKKHCQATLMRRRRLGRPAHE